jgi:alpha-2-macroglobulin
MNRLLTLGLVLLACLPLFAQQSLKDIRKKSWQTYVYRISADTAEKYIDKGIRSPEPYLAQQPFMTRHADSLDLATLPAGNYLVMMVEDNKLKARVFCRSHLQVKAINDQKKVQLEIRDSAGRYLDQASVWVNGKPVRYNAVTKSYRVNQKKPEDALVKIAFGGDTLFQTLSSLSDLYKGGWSQWWRNFSYTRIGRYVTWPVRSVKYMITHPAYSWFHKRYRVRARNIGYMVFNKPKYQPLDTLKFKAYLLTQKGKQYKEPLDVSLQYFKVQQVQINLGSLKPQTPGAFIHEFVLGDSLDSDRQYTIVFRNKKADLVFQQSFRIEDYVLDEMTAQSLRSEKETYFRSDTLVFMASAKDANGLSVMDGRVTLYVLARNIIKFYKDEEFVPDTLWKQEKVLDVNADTKFEIPASNFPEADLSLEVQAVFRNSNNELEQEKTTVTFLHQARMVTVKQQGDQLFAELIENGKPVKGNGWLKKTYMAHAVPVAFPFKEKIDVYTGSYFFSVLNNEGKQTAFADWTPASYRPMFRRMQNKDTAGFVLHNPGRIPLHYTVFYGNRVITRGADSTEFTGWKNVLRPSKAYRVSWQYIWAGREETSSESLMVLDKLLSTKITGTSTIYPGQTDTITVSVKDYKGRPAPDVNLTAVSYNNQFANADVPQPPYLRKYKRKRIHFRDRYGVADVDYSRNFALGQHADWINEFHLDSMEYYKLLFPKDSFYKAATVTRNFEPQLGIHVVRQGVRQEIHMLYLNRQLVYYNGVTDKSNYAFTVLPGYTKIGIRLRDQFIEVDSIYLQPYYKLDISFDLDHLPRKTIAEKRPDYYLPAERQALEGSIWQLKNDKFAGNSYVWQNDRLVFIKARQKSYDYRWDEYYMFQHLSYERHVIGPFIPNDSLQFFKPREFDIKFAFESGYEYSLTPKMARLERKNLFPLRWKKVNLPLIFDPQWILGDTVVASPKIEYPAPVYKPALISNDYQFNVYLPDAGKLLFVLPPDSTFSYMVLWSKYDSVPPRIKSFNVWEMKNIRPGVYDIVFVTNHYNYLQLRDVVVTVNGTTCIRVSPVYSQSNAYVSRIFEGYETGTARLANIYGSEYLKRDSVIVNAAKILLPTGNATIFGRVVDKNGKDGVPFVSVYVKGYNQGFITASDGSFTIRNIMSGNYTLVASMVGYQVQEVNVTASEGISVPINIALAVAENHLQDVVVVGYGTSKRRSLLAPSFGIDDKDMNNLLIGRVAGVDVSGGKPDGNLSIRVRGQNTTSPLYVVNGVAMERLPDGFDMSKAMVDYLNDASATELYGERAAFGVVVVTTADGMPKELRDKFRDYAFWQPNLFTDNDGNVKFTVTYPDNITGWQTHVVGMDKKRRITKASTGVKSFKPLVAQLSTPQFLVEGDSVALIGKTTNYTKEDYSATTSFTTDGVQREPVAKLLAASSANVEELAVVAAGDTVKAQFLIATSAGYRDGELRKIPVVKKGIEETIGKFWIMSNETTSIFTPDSTAGPVTLHIENNTLDVLLEEIEKLKKYPYYCMEQIASKLMGLVMEKKIRAALNQDFKGGREMQRLLSKLQKAQLYEGGWSWWEGGKANLTITNYISRSLLLLRDQPLVATNVRNALLYLHNQLDRLSRNEMIATLFTLSEAGHDMNYKNYLDRLVFDSLTVHQQWEIVKIKQNQKLDYKSELQQLMNKKHQVMLGGVYWGDESYYWDRNKMATTVLAYRTLENEVNYEDTRKQIIQFFLEQRNTGSWMNTVESASVVSAILPSLLKSDSRFTEKASVRIGEPSAAPITNFPFTTKVSSISNPLTISKSGGGLIYVTAYQEVFRNDPAPVTDKFAIRTWFERSGSNAASLKAGEKVIMKISLDVFKDAEYVQVEIPIPAGCTYGDKKQAWNMHKEFLKDKAVFFVEELRAGNYTYEIELEPRYTGTFTMNSAKAELMYFPVFFGRNATKKVAIKK